MTPVPDFTVTFWDAEIGDTKALIAQLESALAASPLYQQVLQARGALALAERYRELAATLASEEPPPP